MSENGHNYLIRVKYLDSKGIMESFKFTETEFDTNIEYLITNLSRKEFDTQILKELYRMWWGIETSFRELKYAIGLASFRSKKTEFVQQEIYAKLIMYNFCEMVITNIIIRNKPWKHTYQANFTMAVNICKRFFCQKRCQIPLDVEALIQKYILPIRKKPRIRSKKICKICYQLHI